MRVIRRVVSNGETSVRNLMSKSIVGGDPRQTLVEAAAEMRAHRVSALVVLDKEVIVGIVTERDFMRAIADGRDPGRTHVSQYMTHSPKTIEADESAGQAAEVMIKHRVRHLPVTVQGRLVGFLSARDLLALRPWPKLPIGEQW
jgi:CBS domain-containing protein